MTTWSDGITTWSIRALPYLPSSIILRPDRYSLRHNGTRPGSITLIRHDTRELMTTYGIDLGTTYSCISRIDDTGKPIVIRNTIGEESTPSVIFFESQYHVVVGR